MPRPTHVSTRTLPLQDCHPLWCAFPDTSGRSLQSTGLVPVRSSLLGESRLLSFPPATEIFQFAGFASYAYGFSARYHIICGGLPHSEIRESTGAHASARLIAVCHVLHRLSTPRHPPDALRSLARSSTKPNPITQSPGQPNQARYRSPSIPPVRHRRRTPMTRSPIGHTPSTIDTATPASCREPSSRCPTPEPAPRNSRPKAGRDLSPFPLPDHPLQRAGSSLDR